LDMMKTNASRQSIQAEDEGSSQTNLSKLGSLKPKNIPTNIRQNNKYNIWRNDAMSKTHDVGHKSFRQDCYSDIPSNDNNQSLSRKNDKDQTLSRMNDSNQSLLRMNDTNQSLLHMNDTNKSLLRKNHPNLIKSIRELTPLISCKSIINSDGERGFH
jgi:hypothetical protein